MKSSQTSLVFQEAGCREVGSFLLRMQEKDGPRLSRLRLVILVVKYGQGWTMLIHQPEHTWYFPQGGGSEEGEKRSSAHAHAEEGKQKPLVCGQLMGIL